MVHGTGGAQLEAPMMCLESYQKVRETRCADCKRAIVVTARVAKYCPECRKARDAKRCAKSRAKARRAA